MRPPVLVIPAYNPDHQLIKLLSAHRAIYPDQECIVVNDGSKPECEEIFQTIEAQNIIVLHHKVNAGKGEALKTGMRYFLAHHYDDSVGIVTADADGQHTVLDIMKISQAMLNHPQQLHLGIREITRKNVPLRSRFGNSLTRLLFNRLTKNQVKDTQTGLRGIPINLIQRMIDSKSSRYEFEFEMFFVARQLGTTIQQTPIQTIYINNNEGSHFNPFLDSLKIYYIFIRFCGVALFSFFIDFSLFCAIFYQSQNMGEAMLGARLVSATINFILNKNITFKANNNIIVSAAKFSLLALVIGTTSYKLLQLLSQTGLSIYCSKILAEFLLFMASFMVQYAIIFSKKRIEERYGIPLRSG